MKKIRISLLLLLLSSSAFAQIVFESGYFISENDERIECLIKNSDWKNNPSEFTYKLSETGDTQTGTLSSVKAFVIPGSVEYRRFNVSIDRSTSDLRNLSTSRNPEFSDETLFLKVLVEGEITLYSFIDGQLKRYFFSSKSSPIEQLVYKLYQGDGLKMRRNITYQQQLLNAMNPECIPGKNLDLVKYTATDLEKLFRKYNVCTGTSVEVNNSNKNMDWYRLNIRPGIRYTSFAVEYFHSDLYTVDFGSSMQFRIGIENEFILPFNKNKWAIIIEPTFQQYNASTETDSHQVTAKHTSLELPVGIRYYIFLNAKSKIFLNGMALLDFPLQSSVEYSSGQAPLQMGYTNTPAVGVGYKFGKFGIEARYLFSRNVVWVNQEWKSEFSSVSFILGYSVF